MALVPCSECREKISDKAGSCPRCGAPQKRRKTSKLAWLVLGLLGLGVLTSLVESPMAPNPAATVSAAPARVGPAPIDPNVFDPYTPDAFPKTFAAWGVDGVARIQRLREAAAKTVAANRSCDRVEISDFAESRSTPPAKPVVFVDCKNSERFYLSEADVGAPVESQMQKSNKLSSIDLIEACIQGTIDRLNFPSTFDRKLFTTSSRQAGVTGNWVVEFQFTAKNAYGMELPSSARCTATPEGQLEVSVITR